MELEWWFYGSLASAPVIAFVLILFSKYFGRKPDFYADFKSAIKKAQLDVMNKALSPCPICGKAWVDSSVEKDQVIYICENAHRVLPKDVKIKR